MVVAVSMSVGVGVAVRGARRGVSFFPAREGVRQWGLVTGGAICCMVVVVIDARVRVGVTEGAAIAGAEGQGEGEQKYNVG